MTFRYDTQDLPFNESGRHVWYAGIGDGELKAFPSSKAGKRDLVDAVKSKTFKFVLGVWNGRWKTDIFVLDQDELLKRLSD